MLVAAFAGSLSLSIGASAAPRSRSAVNMQVAAEAQVAQPVALAKAADEARGLAIDSISKAHSGHMGLPLGCAEVGAVLWGQEMSYNPDDPTWLNRDRFILSAGHGSMFLYSWLHIAGYDLPKEEVSNFRVKDSKTPGHPEWQGMHPHTPGIESTTGPLGQGIGNGVGMAAAAKQAAATLNTADHTIIDHHVVVLCGDGCLQEGVANEAVAFAGHEKLDNLILMYDSNGVTLDKMAEHTQSEDVSMRFEAQGWEVLEVDGHDMDAITKAYRYAKDSDNGKPTLIVCKTIIGKGIDEIAGTCAAHGEAGVQYQDSGREALGLPADEKWYVSPDTYDYFKSHKAELVAKYDEWQETFKAWKAANADKAAMLEKPAPSAEELMAKMGGFEVGSGVATRNAGAEVLQPIAQEMPFYLSGSADLHGSNKNYMKGVGDFSKNNYAGRNFYYGIREHGMGAILNGMAFYGLHTVSGSTFLVFSGYMMGSVRVAALSGLPVSYIWTHDSIGVGEDGPTHQPVEVVAGLRAMPNLDVMRPGDAEETAAAYASSVTRPDGPTALILSRQNLAVIDTCSAEEKRAGTLKGGYVAKKEEGELEGILIGVGSELELAINAAKELGKGWRVVSMPCVEAFERQSAEYIESVLPKAMKAKTTAAEAGYTAAWYKYADKVLGVDSFGLSAPGDEVFEAKGLTVPALVALAK
ncbi:plastid transketolase [Emiliania huxleyi CCMP1516]|uniref:Transketolase n=2 Tax=Emiliania huxleyi TaxID=2903 RepID=A0A0D3IFD9_EMIH1|nr:plastid transketolase [Emiliania huxleyi CCMP1516]EOD09974.1 plastid transketolase [Emiliania huxleyi CCMP1516]|eukprot:XP_005762403.1 plastid transketolase [Emiliania huxleyi CCMP1516]